MDLRSFSSLGLTLKMSLTSALVLSILISVRLQGVIVQVVLFAIWNVLVVTDAASTLPSDIITGAGAGAAPPSAEAILDQALHLVMLGMIKRPAGFSLLAAQKRWVAKGKKKTLLEVLWMLGEHEKYMKLCKARVDCILESMIRGGDGCVREEVKRFKGWIDGSDLGRGGSMSGRGVARQPGLNKDEERKRAAKKRQEAIMQQMKAQ